jgi:hypothetical protein
MSEPTPQLNGMIICDTAFQQAPSGKWCVIGSYNTVLVREFPTTHMPFVVFLALSDFTGNVLLRLCVRDPEGAELCQVRGQFPKIPMTSVELAMPFPPITFQRAGTHSLELYHGNTMLHMRSFQVLQAPQQARPEGETPTPPPDDAR